MRKFFISTVLLLDIAVGCIAQNVGINTNSPQVALDINGALALRSDSVPALSTSITTLNTTNRSYIKFSSNNASASSRLVNLSPGKPGQLLTLEFFPPGQATMVNGSGLSNGGKLLLTADMVFSTPAFITLICSGKNWKELYRNTNVRSSTEVQTSTFSSPGIFTFIVPPGITSVQVQLWGAGGWGGGASSDPKGQGGYGGFVSGSLLVNQGETIDVIVGGGGFGGATGFKAGLSAVKRGNTYLGVAAGGGNGSRNGGYGGAGGPSGINGSYGTDPYLDGSTGGGATPSTGGTGGFAGSKGSYGESGSALNGGTNINYTDAKGEGWGGNGWFGGGASGTYSSTFYLQGPYATGGGGGGSNYTGGLNGAIVNNSNGSTGGGGNAPGSGGLVKISW